MRVLSLAEESLLVSPKDEANMTGRRAKNAKEKQMKRQADARASREGRGDPAPERDVQWEQHLKLRLWQKQAKDKKPVEKKVQKKPQSTESKAEVMGTLSPVALVLCSTS
ncbi:hypothetical protein A0H81_09529 [Grifola frondosa]|uniref:Uncharacterized protein n=1 Tax=Grifola frondosa TaxID=5627 RepID=A0A1C7M1C8_GRIFR|nr:hypothetical protein A0H81_09529 [Grifola frondosa]